MTRRPAVWLRGVDVVVDGVTILAGIDLDVPVRAHVAVLGPNGSGKTTLLRVMSGYRFPTRGDVAVLGERFGRTDLRLLRRRVGLVSTALDDLLQVRSRALHLVAAAVHGATWPSADHLRDRGAVAAARRALARAGAAELAERSCHTLSQGEWQRVRIARSLAGEPELLLLDEPFAGLDLGGRETLLRDLDRLMVEDDGPTVVLVAHHLEEVPTAIRRGLLLRGGRVVASGGVDAVLTSRAVSDAFGVAVEIAAGDGRYAARVRTETASDRRPVAPQVRPT